jgi:glycosyltransferase involved in cell wall biosynthesis
VWIGNLGNAFYLRSVLPALEQVAQRIPFQLRLIGGGDILSIKSDTLHIDYREWREEVEIELLAHSDIGIMPLENQAYEKGKCAFKLIQYFSLGLPVVASPVGMNASLIRHGDNGLLAETPAEWVSAISQLLTTPSLRLRCAEGGRLTYEAGYTRERGAAAWIPLIRALASAKRKT